jgi:hypothetical protein
MFRFLQECIPSSQGVVLVFSGLVRFQVAYVLPYEF